MLSPFSDAPVPMRARLPVLSRRFLPLCLIVLLPACQYIVDAVRYTTQEEYVSGKEARYRIESAAYIGFGLHFVSNPGSDGLAPIVAALSTRVKEDRDYLETSVATCEETLLVSNFTAQPLSGQILAGLVCNLGPGKRPDQL